MAAVATEDFTGSAGVLSGTATTTGGKTWVSDAAVPGSRFIRRNGSGGGATSSGAGDEAVYFGAGHADHFAELAYNTQDTNYGAAVRIADRLNLIFAEQHVGGSHVLLRKRVGGTYSTVASISVSAFSAGVLYGLEAEGSDPVNVKVYRNGVLVGASDGYDIADSVFDDVENIGIYAGTNTRSFDNWEGGTLGEIPTQEAAPTDLEIDSLIQTPLHIEATFSAAAGGSETGTNPQYVISESDTAPGAESEDWIDLAWGDLPYTVNVQGSRPLHLHMRTDSETLEPSEPVTLPFTSPDLETEPEETGTLTVAEFDTAEIDSNGAEAGNRGVLSWRGLDADGNTRGENITIVVTGGG